MSFNEANTVEAFVRDRLCGGITHHTAVGPGLARRHGQVSGLGWHFLARRTCRASRTRSWSRITCARR